MKRIHLLRTAAAPGRTAALVEAGRGAGLRAGWLDLSGAPPPPDDLGRAAEAGVLRAVAVGGGRSVAVKRLAGPPVLRDLLREHFLGCAFVLIHAPGDGAPPPVEGLGELPLLEPLEGAWRLRSPSGSECELSTAELVARLRSPRPL